MPVRLAVMQPYFLPHIGYFQLLAAVDRFVIFDDVNYMKGGWINRNRILVGRKPAFFTVPLDNASPNRKIRDIALADPCRWTGKFLKTVEQSYSKAPYFTATFALLSDILERSHHMLTDLIADSLVTLCKQLDLRVELVRTSTEYGNEGLRGQARVIDICRREGATSYVNSPGGRSLYDKAIFAQAGIRLHFLQSGVVEYQQFPGCSHPGLSIVDVLMFNSLDEVRTMLRERDID